MYYTIISIYVFQKVKDEALYEQIVSHKVKQSQKEEETCKAARALENIYGRGRVVIEDELPAKGFFFSLPKFLLL